VLYIGYTQLVGGAWQGGVLRLTTGGGTGIDAEDSNVANWKLSTVITVPGAVTTSVSFIQDRTNHELWLYFGTGRYFWKIGTNVDDANTQQALYGIKEPCYSNGTTPAGVPTDSLSMTCTSTVSTSGLINSTTSPPSSDAPTGWFINLAASTTSNYAERVVTDPLAAFTGAAFFTTFEPSTAACGFSGNSYLWAVNYNTGGSAPASALSGSALLQVSTGQVQQVTLSSAFTGNVPTGGTQGRTSAALLGVPPKGQGLSVIIQPRPLNKVLQIQEK
jgi:type IV pilus assembly protein PilY1